MARGRVDIGPLRCVRGPERDLVDVHFDGKVLVLTSYHGVGAVLDRYRLVFLAVGIVLSIAGAYAGDPARGVLLTVGPVGIGGFLGLSVFEGLRTLVRAARGGGLRAAYRTVRDLHDGTRTEVPEVDIELMDPVVEGLRPLLVLHTRHGEIALSGFPWRASQLRRLQIELGRE